MKREIYETQTWSFFNLQRKKLHRPRSMEIPGRQTRINPGSCQGRWTFRAPALKRPRRNSCFAPIREPEFAAFALYSANKTRPGGQNNPEWPAACRFKPGGKISHLVLPLSSRNNSGRWDHMAGGAARLRREIHARGRGPLRSTSGTWRRNLKKGGIQKIILPFV